MGACHQTCHGRARWGRGRGRSCVGGVRNFTRPIRTSNFMCATRASPWLPRSCMRRSALPRALVSADTYRARLKQVEHLSSSAACVSPRYGGDSHQCVVPAQQRTVSFPIAIDPCLTRAACGDRLPTDWRRLCATLALNETLTMRELNNASRRILGEMHGLLVEARRLARSEQMRWSDGSH